MLRDVGSICTVSKEDKSYDSIFAPNKAVANETSDELIKILLPTTQLCTNKLSATDESLIKKRFATWKRSLKVKERIMTLKFRTLQYSWKKDLNVLSVKCVGGKSNKKFESSSRMGYANHQRHHASTQPCLSSSGGLKLVPTTEIVDYVNKLLSDSRVRIYRKELKMPSLMLDKGERSTSMFSSNNGLVEDPIDVEKEKSIINRWTPQDKELFLEKYSLFGKNFRKIASFFKHKTVADCVEFYYKNHKSDYFPKTKKKPEFAKGKSYTTNTYLVTSEKQRLNREVGATSSLDMLGSASEMVSNEGWMINRSSDKNLENLNDLSIYCNEQEAAAADVLAGICGSISSEPLGSCITSLADQGKRYQKLGNGCSLNDVDEETCSDDSCGEETNSCVWTDEEKSSFVKAVKCYGKDFSMISRFVKTRSSDQCRVFFSKARKCLGLDAVGVGSGSGSEGTTGANHGGGSGSDDACMVDSGSVISHDKSSGEECKMEEFEDLHSSDSKKELVELSHISETKVKLEERSLNVHSEGAADSEAAANPEESPPNTHSDSNSGAKVEPAIPCKEETTESESQLPNLNSASFYSRNLSIDHGTNPDLNTASENLSSQEHSNGFVMSNLFPKRSLSQDNASSRLSFRKSSQKASSTDGYNLHLSNHSLLDYAESSQILENCPAKASVHSNCKLNESLLMDPCFPKDGSIQKTCNVSQAQRRSSSLDVENPRRGGDVKLFGQILTNNSSNKLLPKEEKTNSGMSISLKFEQSNLQLSSHGFWDGNRIQTGFPSLPDSAFLLAKYPSAFQDPCNLKGGNNLNNLNNLNVLTGFPARKLSSIYGRQEAKLLLPEIEPLSSVQQQGRGMKVVGGGICNGVSDPVAAIRLHYAKSQQYKKGGAAGGDTWMSKAANDVGSR